MRLVDRRVGLLFALFALCLMVVMGRAVWVQAVRGGELSAEARSQQIESITVPGGRGRILDREGGELAVSEDAASVFATPYQVPDPARAAAKLAPVLGVPTTEVAEALSDRDSGFAYLRRKVGLETAERVRKLKVKGVGLLPDSRRVYPDGNLASQVIGAVGIDNQGLTGLESAHEELLHGTDGEREVTRDALGEEIERHTVTGVETGEDLRLTLDASLQAHTEQVLADLGATYQPEGATAIVMDPNTGELLAVANWPAADLERVATEPEDSFDELATGFTFEPGSTFKAFTVAGALEESIVTPRTMFDLPPTIKVADREIGESHERGYVSLSVAEILAQSSNVGAVKVGLELGPDRLDAWIRKFGFGEPTALGFPGEEQGIVPSPEEYSGSTIGNLPIGQGLSVTPMQLVTAYAAIANGGTLRPPRLVLEEGGEPQVGPAGERVIGTATATKLRRMLRGVLAPDGTASEVSVPGYELAGKTGTAEKAVDGEYSESRFVASFVGFAPARDPGLLVAVVVDEPEGGYYGAEVAAPAFAEIARFALPHLGIPPG